MAKQTFMENVIKPVRIFAFATIFTASVFSGALLQSCSKHPEPVKITATQSMTIKNNIPSIRSVEFDYNKNTILVNKGAADCWVFKVDSPSSLQGAKIHKVASDLWCITNVGDLQEMLVMSPLIAYQAGNEKSWKIDIDSRFASSTLGAKLLSSTFCVFSDSSAAVISDSNEVFRLHYGMNFTPKHPGDIDPFGIRTQRSLFFDKYEFTAIKRREHAQLGPGVKGRLLITADKREILELTHPGWQQKYLISFTDKEAPEGAHIKVGIAPLNYVP